MSYRLAAVAINSMAQHANPIGIGHMEFVRHQFSTASRSPMTWASGTLEMTSAMSLAISP